MQRKPMTIAIQFTVLRLSIRWYLLKYYYIEIRETRYIRSTDNKNFIDKYSALTRITIQGKVKFVFRVKF